MYLNLWPVRIITASLETYLKLIIRFTFIFIKYKSLESDISSTNSAVCNATEKNHT